MRSKTVDQKYVKLQCKISTWQWLQQQYNSPQRNAPLSLLCVLSNTAPTSLRSDNTQNLHGSTVERIPKQCPYPTSKVNVLAIHQTIRSQPMSREAIQHTISVILTMQKTNFNHKYFFSCRCLHLFRSYVHMCHVLQAQHLMSMANYQIFLNASLTITIYST